jgi:hypothetical protein
VNQGGTRWNFEGERKKNTVCEEMIVCDKGDENVIGIYEKRMS